MQHIKCQIIQNCQKIWETSGNFALISNFGILTFDLLNYILLFRNLKKRQKIFYYTACECVELVHGASTWSVWAERVECVEWVRGESECGLQVGARSECAEWVRGASARSECAKRVRKASAQSECAKRVRGASARTYWNGCWCNSDNHLVWLLHQGWQNNIFQLRSLKKSQTLF
jgi:hypothetical protein